MEILSNKKYCVYTCLIGNYDCLYNYKCYDDEFDYICFTNIHELIEKKELGKWKILGVNAELEKKYDATRLNRYYKIQYYKEMMQYDISIYIDTNISIKTDYIYNLAKCTKKELLFPKNISTTNVYDQIIMLEIQKKDAKDNLEKIYNLLVSEKFPRDYGFTENNLIIRRHNNKTVDNIMDMWWYYIENYSKRDQASLVYVLWKHNIAINEVQISNVMRDKFNFIRYPHLNDKSLRLWHLPRMFRKNVRLYTPISVFMIIVYLLKAQLLFIPRRICRSTKFNLIKHRSST